VTNGHSWRVQLNLADRNDLRELSGRLGRTKRKRGHSIQGGIDRNDVNERPFDIVYCALARGRMRHIGELHILLVLHLKFLRVRRGRGIGSRQRIEVEGGRLVELLAIRVLFIEVRVAHELVIDGRRGKLSIARNEIEKKSILIAEGLFLLGD